MSVSRRELISGALISGALVGCGPLANRAIPNGAEVLTRKPLQTPTDRVVNRLAFGPSEALLAELNDRGIEGYIQGQLTSEATREPALAVRLRHLEALELEAAELTDLPEDEVLRQLQAASIISAAYSAHQLHERMVDFWSNHFNIYARKERGAYRVAVDQRSTIRKHALGSFTDLLLASARSTAMLVYLDNQLNSQAGPNENYARELMELHTLGVNGGYTQHDVKEVARCFTGWSMENRLLRPRGRFRFDESKHDSGSKVVLGKRLPADGGEKDGMAVLELLATHDKTAEFITGKLCRYFLGHVEPNVHQEASRAFLESKGDIRATLKPILTKDRLSAGEPIIKRPFDLAVSAIRSLGASTDGGKGLQRHLEAMGQPLFQWPMPDGFPDHTGAWAGSLLPRWNFALALLKGEISGTVVEADPTQQEDFAFRLCSPEFQWR